MTSPDWADGFLGAITICDREGIIVYMNETSIRQFAKYGGKNLIGSNLNDCHPEPAKNKLNEMLNTPMTNSYTIEKNGIRRIISQSPWMQNGEFKGIIEISFELPNPTPHFVRE